MAYQKLLKKAYIEQVFEDVSQEKGLERFLEDTFPIDEDYLMVTPQVMQLEGLLEKLVPTSDGDFKSGAYQICQSGIHTF